MNIITFENLLTVLGLVVIGYVIGFAHATWTNQIFNDSGLGSLSYDQDRDVGDDKSNVEQRKERSAL